MVGYKEMQKKAKPKSEKKFKIFFEVETEAPEANLKFYWKYIALSFWKLDITLF